MSLTTLLLIILLVLVLASFPAWPYSRTWGDGPAGLLGTVLVVLLILYLLGMF